MRSLKGQLLIAAPGLADPNFRRTVVFVAEHNAEGAFGLVLNRPAEARVSELWNAISNEACDCHLRAYVGGPVQQNAVLLLHGFPDLAKDADPVIPGVYLGSEVEVLGELVRRHSGEEPLATEEFPKFRVFCGYSGWGAGQLDAEMKAGGWLTQPASFDVVFRTPPERLWNLALEAIGGVYRFFALMPQEPEHN